MGVGCLLIKAHGVKQGANWERILLKACPLVLAGSGIILAMLDQSATNEFGPIMEYS